MTSKRNKSDNTDIKGEDNDGGDRDFVEVKSFSRSEAQEPQIERIKKKRKLETKDSLKGLPQGESYNRVYENDATITCLANSRDGSILATGSNDGTVKFWSKQVHVPRSANEKDKDEVMQLVKLFTAHPGKQIVQLIIDLDGNTMASVAQDDHTIKIFSLSSLDMIQVFDLKFYPNTETCYSNCFFKSGGKDLFLVGEAHCNKLYFANFELDELELIQSIHKNPISSVVFNSKYECFISADTRGIVEYWSPESFEIPSNVDFIYKSGTDLYDFVRCKSQPSCICLNDDNESFATISLPDNLIRIFNVRSGKLLHKFEESLSSYEELVDYKQLSRERALYSNKNGNFMKARNIIFTKGLLIFGSILGIKVLDMDSGQVLKVYGSEDQKELNIRLNQVAFFENNAFTTLTSKTISAENPLINSNLNKGSLLIASPVSSKSFFVFGDSTVDVSQKENSSRLVSESESPKDITRAILHTSVGDIKIKLFSKLAPKTVENFIKLCESRYYNNVIFHRVIKDFMVQSGDPSGTGTGGESMWGGNFEDEFNPLLSHSEPYMVSMANAGPNTNGSQFFITTQAAEWLDNKHSVFGKVVEGQDIVKQIESKETDENDKPINLVYIMSTSLQS
ncbi:uncharacterized protein PRCAT00004046001 [Priceomyces carsonii]|uniref:uncharacterized protein n=1 Tax=Priceomyces carsonii TaxID=28549 RepID=UPI002ED8C8F4|nr:unnamed protein product [Priceomyces carsonii]